MMCVGLRPIESDSGEKMIAPSNIPANTEAPISPVSNSEAQMMSKSSYQLYRWYLCPLIGLQTTSLDLQASAGSQSTHYAKFDPSEVFKHSRGGTS